MKAVIVDIEGKIAVAMNKKGDFVKINNNGMYQVGYEVDVPSSNVFNLNMFRRTASIAAAVLFFAVFGLGAYAYTIPYSYIDVDINPSIEITTNIYDRIIKAEGLNDDGKRIISNTTYKNMGVNDGVQEMLKSAVSEGYLMNSSTSAVMLTVSGKDEEKVKKIEVELQNTADKELKSAGAKAEVLVANVSLKSRDEAKVQGISPGKLLLIERLNKLSPEVKVDDYKSAPVKEIMSKINEKKRLNREEDKADKEEIKSIDSENSKNNRKTNKKEDLKLNNSSNTKTSDKSSDEDKSISNKEDKILKDGKTPNKGDEQTKNNDDKSKDTKVQDSKNKRRDNNQINKNDDEEESRRKNDRGDSKRKGR